MRIVARSPFPCTGSRTAPCTMQNTARSVCERDLPPGPTRGALEGQADLPRLPNEQEADTPIFSLGQVQFTLPSALFSLSCANNVLVLAVTGSAPSRTAAPAPPTSHPQLIRIDLAHPTEVETIEIPLAQPQAHGRNTPAPAPPSLHKVHVDPSGRHVLVSTSSGENFYLYVGVLPANLASSNASPARKVRPLPRLKGAIVDSVTWSPSSFASPSASTSFSTREILLGTTTGQILETTLVDPALASDAGGFSLPVPGRAPSPERYVKQLLTLPERQSIVGLRYEIWNTRRLAVVAATTTKVYQYVGDGATLGNQKHSRDDDPGLLETVLHLYASGDVRPSELSALSTFARVSPLITFSAMLRDAGTPERLDTFRAAFLRAGTDGRQGGAGSTQEHGLDDRSVPGLASPS